MARIPGAQIVRAIASGKRRDRVTRSRTSATLIHRTLQDRISDHCTRLIGSQRKSTRAEVPSGAVADFDNTPRTVAEHGCGRPTMAQYDRAHAAHSRHRVLPRRGSALGLLRPRRTRGAGQDRRAELPRSTPSTSATPGWSPPRAAAWRTFELPTIRECTATRRPRAGRR